MPTTKPRTMITFNDKQLFERVNTFRFDNRYKSQNDAIMALLDRGIEIALSETGETEAIKLTEEDISVLTAYRNADDRARADAMRTLKEHPRTHDKKQV